MMFEEVERYLKAREAEFGSISAERKELLDSVAAFIQTRIAQGKPARLTFICTHNSRRSHLSQVWAQIAADSLGLKGIETFSGGTEATAFNPRAVDALRRCGLAITSANPEASNPIYEVKAGTDERPQLCWSKVYDQTPNPTTEFAAIMTCSEADGACPIVPGCELRAPVRYEDPKVADGTPEEASRYSERSAQICREMLYMMSQVTKQA